MNPIKPRSPELIKLILSSSLSYGFRRIQAELKDKHKIILNHKPLQRLLNLWGLSLRRHIKTPARSGIQEILDYLGVKANLLKTIGHILPFSLIYTDMTEIIYAKGKLYLIAYLDHTTKKILGFALSNHPEMESFNGDTLVSITLHQTILLKTY